MELLPYRLKQKPSIQSPCYVIVTSVGISKVWVKGHPPEAEIEPCREMDVQTEGVHDSSPQKKKGLQYLRKAEEDDPTGRKFSAFFFLNISKQFIAFFHSKNESQGKL